MQLWNFHKIIRGMEPFLSIKPDILLPYFATDFLDHANQEVHQTMIKS